MKSLPSPQRGVTLIELVIVTGIIATLASVALPTYRTHTVKVRRSEAKVALSQTAQFLERCFTRFNTYNDAGCTPGLPLTTERGSYAVTGAITATTYTLTATPQGTQARDTLCNNLTLDQLGNKAETGSGTLADCW